jgi:hypothetical protein
MFYLLTRYSSEPDVVKTLARNETYKNNEKEGLSFLLFF